MRFIFFISLYYTLDTTLIREIYPHIYLSHIPLLRFELGHFETIIKAYMSECSAPNVTCDIQFEVAPDDVFTVSQYGNILFVNSVCLYRHHVHTITAHFVREKYWGHPNQVYRCIL